jgi:hypothetical protein
MFLLLVDGRERRRVFAVPMAIVDRGVAPPSRDLYNDRYIQP